MRINGWRLAMAVAVALAACGGDDGGGGQVSDAITGLDTPVGSDAFAPADGQGDAGPEDGTDAIASPACQTDADCAEPGAVCSCTGACVVPAGGPCEKAFNCATGTWCDPCVRHCMPVLGLCEACEPVKLCEPGGACTTVAGGPCEDQGACLDFAVGGSFCGLGCLSEAGCPKGFQCLAVDGVGTKQCVPKSGACEALGLCEDDGDCPDGQVCNEALKECGQGCVDDVSCAGGKICVGGRCVPPCETDADCEAPKTCREDGRCKVPGGCEVSSECEPENYCDKLLQKCVPGCLLDEHCQDASKECKNLLCVQKGCTHNYQCAFEQECEKTTGQCIPMTRDHCATCDAQSQAAQCGGDPNLCVSFQDEEENPLGDFCLLLCDEDEIDKCPQGYGCQHIESDDGSINGDYCVRECYKEPIGAP